VGCSFDKGRRWGTIASVERLNVIHRLVEALPSQAKWALGRAASNARYATFDEKAMLVAKQAASGRPEATRAAPNPIRKNAAWWDLPQDERRKIFEERSHHNQTGIKYLPEIARRPHDCRVLSQDFRLPEAVRLRAGARPSV